MTINNMYIGSLCCLCIIQLYINTLESLWKYFRTVRQKTPFGCGWKAARIKSKSANWSCSQTHIWCVQWGVWCLETVQTYISLYDWQAVPQRLLYTKARCLSTLKHDAAIWNKKCKNRNDESRGSATQTLEGGQINTLKRNPLVSNR